MEATWKKGLSRAIETSCISPSMQGIDMQIGLVLEDARRRRVDSRCLFSSATEPA
jgi:hypothetical protein